MGSPPSPRTAAGPLSGALVVQYLGFQDAPGRREYAIGVRRGDRSHRYTLWIERAAFAERRALLQDGPDICYQKLLRALADPELLDAEPIGVTEGDLASYRETHTRPARRGFSLPRPTIELKPTAVASPVGHDLPPHAPRGGAC